MKKNLNIKNDDNNINNVLIKDLYKYINLYYGLNKYTQKIIRACWGFSIKSKNIYNIGYIIDLEKFLVENFFNENFIKKVYIRDINFYKNLKNYKGFRFNFKLPLKGQRTKTNRKTSRSFTIPLISIQDLNFKIKNKLFK